MSMSRLIRSAWSKLRSKVIAPLTLAIRGLAIHGKSSLRMASNPPTLARTIGQRRQRNQPRTTAKQPAVCNMLPISGIGPDKHHHQWNWHGLPMESTGRNRPL